MPPSFKIGNPSSLCLATWPSCWRRTLIGWLTMPGAQPWPACAPSRSMCQSVMTGTTSTSTCLAKTWRWPCNSCCATWDVTLALWRVTSCVRCSWSLHCGSPWLISLGRPLKWSWWRSTQSSASWSLMSFSRGASETPSLKIRHQTYINEKKCNT